MPVSLYAFVPQLGCKAHFLNHMIYNGNPQNVARCIQAHPKCIPNADMAQLWRQLPRIKNPPKRRAEGHQGGSRQPVALCQTTKSGSR